MAEKKRNTIYAHHLFWARSSIGISCLIIFSLLFLSNPGNAQSVLAGAGATGKSAGGTVDFTLGELSVITVKKGSFEISIGVQQPLVSDTLPRVDSLKCIAFTLDSAARPVENEVFKNTLRLPYVGGNGNRFDTTRFNSQNVTGLTLQLNPGKLAKGDSVLVFSISGIPSKEGVAVFTVDFGQATCELVLDVGAESPKVDSLLCAKAVWSPENIYAKLAYSGALSLPYTGGNGKRAPSAVFNSTEITGLKATSALDTLKPGGGSLQFRLEGTPDATGTARIAVAIGGKTCTLAIAVEEFPLTVPNFFSPNADGANDLWEIPNFQLLYPSGVVVIMDRNGRKLVEFNGNFNGWDGTINGEIALAGVYWYYIQLDQGSEIVKGNLTLIR